jgi:hypothetical protein
MNKILNQALQTKFIKYFSVFKGYRSRFLCKPPKSGKTSSPGDIVVLFGFTGFKNMFRIRDRERNVKLSLIHNKENTKESNFDIGIGKLLPTTAHK